MAAVLAGLVKPAILKGSLIFTLPLLMQVQTTLGLLAEYLIYPTRKILLKITAWYIFHTAQEMSS